MDVMQKLNILAGAAKYDVACTSSGSDRGNRGGGVGNTVGCGICHSFSSDGRCISLLKILLTNYCIYDCTYCVNRSSNDVPRAAFTPEEVIDLTINFYRRNYIEGLFLSSAVVKNPDHTMEMMIKVIRSLREEYKFNGYIHIKTIPGSDERLINEAGRYVDRMSVNIELPSNDSLKLLAPDKKKEAILGPMGYIKQKITESKEDKKYFNKAPAFVPAGQSTQLIVGATPDRDMGILHLSEGLYKKYKLKRVFYSAYVPVNNHSNLPAIAKPPLLREHRLYQADWLLRFYQFSAQELLNDKNPDLNVLFDPKCDWALRNLDYFPVEINRASYEILLRVPGIGVRSAQRIVAARKSGSLDYADLKKLGVVLKRAQFFITCKGYSMNKLNMNENFIKTNLLADKKRMPMIDSGYTQSSFLPEPNIAGVLEEAEAVQNTRKLLLDDSIKSPGNLLLPEFTQKKEKINLEQNYQTKMRAAKSLPDAGSLLLPTTEDVYASITGEY